MPTKQYIKKLNGYYVKDEEARQKMIETSGVTATDYGATGDGTTDDTEAINAAIQACSQSGISLLTIPEGTYVISGELTIPSNMTIRGSAGTIIKYVGDGNSGDIFNVAGTDADHPVENIVIENLIIDGSDQIYKGGYSMDTPRATHTNPGFRGLRAFRVKFCKNITIENCTINDLYGDGICIYYSSDVNIVGNHLYDVGAGNITANGQTGYDNHGDGIVAFSSFNVTFERNTIVNKRVYADGMENAIGKPCGRSGLEFEYAVNQDSGENPDDPEHNAPGYSDFPLDESDKRIAVGLRMRNNYVYGYTKGVHIESQVKCHILDNTLLYNHIAIMFSSEAGSRISGNYINPYGVGEAPQSGYDGYYSGIAISGYGANSKKYGVLVSNNTIEGDGKGVILGSNYVTVQGNIIKTKQGVYTIVTGLKGIVISDNTFNDMDSNASNPIFLYSMGSAIIKGNSFYSDGKQLTLLASGSNMTFADNLFDNVVLRIESGTRNINISSNRFEGEANTSPMLFLGTPKSCSIDNNTFYANTTNYDDRYVIENYSNVTNSKFVANKFYLSNARTSKDVIRCETVEDTRFEDNIAFDSNSDTRFIVLYIGRRCFFIGNKIDNLEGNVVHCTGNFWRWNKSEKNKGKFTSAGYYPNDSLARLANDYYNVSDMFIKGNVNNSSTTYGWLCTKTGYYVTNQWSSASIEVNTLVLNQSGNVYKCIVKGSGSSSVEPTHTTSENVTESDGYEWQYLGQVATFSELTI